MESVKQLVYLDIISSRPKHMSKYIVHKLCLNGRCMGCRAWSNKTRRRPRGFEYYMLLSHVFIDFNIYHIPCLDCTQFLVVLVANAISVLVRVIR